MELEFLLDLNDGRDLLSLPSDLAHFELPMTRVARFHDLEYPPGIIVNNLLVHKRRGVWIIRKLKQILRDFLDWQALNQLLTPELLAETERTFWLHDIAETVDVKDATLFAKYHNRCMAEIIREQERAFAKKHFVAEDQRLIAAYEAAGDYLKHGEGSPANLTPAAVLAKVVDLVEGSITFHRALSTWASDPEFYPGWLPSDPKLVFGLDLQIEIDHRLKSLPPDKQSVGRILILSSMLAIGTMWFHRSPLRYPYQYLDQNTPYIPPVIWEFYATVRSRRPD